VARRSGPVPRAGDEHARLAAAAAVSPRGLRFHTAKAVGILLQRADHGSPRATCPDGRREAEGGRRRFRRPSSACMACVVGRV
jgi:hypothetical protein